MIDTIGRLEEVTIDREAVAGEFIQMAMMFNQSADELIKTPYGSRLYNQILSGVRRSPASIGWWPGFSEILSKSKRIRLKKKLSQKAMLVNN